MYATVAACRGGQAPVGGNRNGAHRAAVTVTCLQLFSGCWVPDADGVIAACGCEHLAIAGENQARDLANMAAHHMDRLAGIEVPEMHAAVVAAGRQPSPIGRARDREHSPMSPAPGRPQFV